MEKWFSHFLVGNFMSRDGNCFFGRDFVIVYPIFDFFDVFWFFWLLYVAQLYIRFSIFLMYFGSFGYFISGPHFTAKFIWESTFLS